MKIVSVKIPESILESIESLVNKGQYASRSEVIRYALRNLIKKENSKK